MASVVEQVCEVVTIEVVKDVEEETTEVVEQKTTLTKEIITIETQVEQTTPEEAPEQNECDEKKVVENGEALSEETPDEGKPDTSSETEPEPEQKEITQATQEDNETSEETQIDPETKSEETTENVTTTEKDTTTVKDTTTEEPNPEVKEECASEDTEPALSTEEQQEEEPAKK